jgi:hypothetical protein
MNQFEELNSAITYEADKILYGLGLMKILSRYGTPVLTGSYLLGLMAWRDLDIYLVNDDITAEKFFQLGGEIVSELKPWRMHYRNELIAKTPDLPDGLYWGLYINNSVFPEDWKIDIWAMGAKQQKIFQDNVDNLKSKLNSENRQVILEIKNRYFMHPEYRRKFGSMDIYNAVILEDVKSVEEFTDWLYKSKGIS